MFGRYAIVREIGRGGMGVVYEAEHGVLRKRVALKVMHENAVDPRAIDRFVREGRAAASIDHRNVVTVIDLGVVDGRPYLVMELLRGEDLATTIQRRAPLALSEALPWIVAVCAAVDAMHRRGIVHRDIKPANIFLAVDDSGAVVPKVLDFGVCREESAFVAPSPDSGLVGTPQYLGPEQVEGAPASALSDQHAVAAVLYEALVGAPAYSGDTLLATLAAIRDGRVRPLAELRGDLPETLCAIIHRALAVDPRARFSTVRELGAALARWVPAPDAPSTVVADALRSSDALAPASSLLAPETQRFGTPAAQPIVPRPPITHRAIRPAIAALLVLGSLAAWAALGRSRDAVSPAPAVSAPPPSTAVHISNEPAPALVAAPLPSAPSSNDSVRTANALTTLGAVAAPPRTRSGRSPRAEPASTPAPVPTRVTAPAINSAPILD